MIRSNVRVVLAVLLVAFVAAPTLAGGYDNALKGVKSFDVVFDFTHGDPKVANSILTAMDAIDDGSEVEAMPNGANIAVVIHDYAVNLISTDRGEHDDTEWAEIQKFQETLKQMKEDGATLEVCQYALDVFGVDRSTVIPEIDQVPNGFVSVVGYQKQGYALVRIP